MGDAGLQPIFESLELGFEVGLARDEEEAASDLAMTLRQAQGLRELLIRRPVLLRAADTPLALVSRVGRDFVFCEREGFIAPLEAAHFVFGAGTPRPESSPETLVQLLRRLARSGASVTVQTTAGEATGALAAAADDHVEIHAATGPVLVPLGRVSLVRLCRGGSADGP